MARNLADLQKECEELGIVVTASGKRASKDDYEVALRDFYWKRDHAGEDMLPQIEPQMAHNIKDAKEVLAEEAWKDGGRYCQQLKLNGARFLMHVGKDKNRFTSRRRSDETYLYSEKTDNFPWHRDYVLAGLEGTVLDGEMKSSVHSIVTDSVTTVDELQATIAITNSSPEKAVRFQEKFGVIQYHVFDCLFWKGEDVRSLPYSHRLELVKKALEGIDSNIFVLVETYYSGKKERYENWVKEGKEGCMLKDLESPYEDGKRTWSWLKVKRFEELDVVVMGYHRGEEGKGYENLVGDLEVGCYDEKTKKLRSVGCVSAMPLEMRREISVYVEKDNVVKLREDILGRVMVVRGQDWTKNVRLSMCRPVIQDPTGTWADAYFRADKAPESCTLDFDAVERRIREKAGL